MKAYIRKSNSELPNLLAVKEVKGVEELFNFLIDNGLHVDIKRLCEDIKWDDCHYFKEVPSNDDSEVFHE